jgi:acetyltransferase-like isoleucine patch superfamily enzyme
MTLQIYDHGHNNQVSLPVDAAELLHGSITLRGNDNVVSIGQAARSHQVTIDVGTQCRVEIGGHVNMGHLFIFGQTAARITIGQHASFNGAVRLMCHEPSSLLIGTDCLFAGDVEVTTSDMHSLIDAESGTRLNPARDIVIEDHVWIGQRAVILKGAQIGQGSVIAACAVVTGRIPPKSSAAGVPARVLRRGVTWRFDLI